MPTEKFERLKPDKKEYILRSASREFAVKEYNEISISKIADEAGISRGSFYLYFKDKEDVFCAVIEAHKDRIRNDLMDIYSHATSTKNVILEVYDYFSHLSTFEQSLFEKISSNMTSKVHELFSTNFTNFDTEIQNRIKKGITALGFTIDKDIEERIKIAQEILFAMLISSLIELSMGRESIEGERLKLERKLDIILEGIKSIINNCSK